MDPGERRRRTIGRPCGLEDSTIINRIMLRFRPIAPKPANVGQDPSASEPDKSSMRRTKRKYVRVCKNDRNSKKVSLSYSSDRLQEKEKEKEKESERQDDDSDFKQVRKTLQLLPEKSDLGESPAVKSRGLSWCNNNLLHLTAANGQPPVNPGRAAETFWLKLKQPEIDGFDVLGTLRHEVPERRVGAVVESWVTVECVTNTDNCCRDAGGLWCTDEERVKNLEEDTCPGFTSDGSNNVNWVNGAYKRLVTVKEECIIKGTSPEIEIIVRLVIKDDLLPFLYLSAVMFTCWVRLHYTWQREKFSQMVPCDVWRMDGGGFAWRLDAEAALSLGRR